MNAYQEGFDAFYTGLDITNPYAEGSDEFEAFAEGYAAAVQDEDESYN